MINIIPRGRHSHILASLHPYPQRESSWRIIVNIFYYKVNKKYGLLKAKSQENKQDLKIYASLQPITSSQFSSNIAGINYAITNILNIAVKCWFDT